MQPTFVFCVATFTDLAICMCHGDPHCETFDRARFSYQGICRFNLVSVNASATGAGLQYFQIYAKNEHRGNTAVSYVKYVEIALGGGDVIRLVGDYQSPAAVPVTAMVVTYLFGYTLIYVDVVFCMC